ncbi:TPA: hypothetical protein N0F65_009647 [Lagenidium giganteum]|uniref:RING-type domain-containing protein n=1 Tax=Lagenidium giganteum TaxID=4803 RepID=A0AAV2YHY1_9STRA|nr:TPA: hypothetical protein N0F65_009647 [Lagenidium giganteum]
MESSAAPRNPYEFTRDAYIELIKNMPKENYSKRSEYEEIELIEDCTLYDLYRQPRQPVTDPTVTRTVPVRVLNADLQCPICLCVVRNTMVVMECLHRFCGECIQKCLRLGMKECPKCRIHIPSKRSLRRDENFDDLIQKIYPDLDEFEQNELKLIEESNRARHFHNAFTESAKMGAQNQATQRRNAGKKKASSPTSSAPTTPVQNERSSSASSASSNDDNGNVSRGAPHASTPENDGHLRKKARTETGDSTPAGAHSIAPTASPGTASSDTTSSTEDDRVNLRVLVHPEESDSAPKLERTLFRTSYRLKVRHLKKHLASILKLDSYANMRIVLPADNCKRSGRAKTDAARKDLLFDQELEDFLTLYDIYQQYGMGTKWELQLYYHFSDSIINGVAQFVPLRINATTSS